MFVTVAWEFEEWLNDDHERCSEHVEDANQVEEILLTGWLREVGTESLHLVLIN